MQKENDLCNSSVDETTTNIDFENDIRISNTDLENNSESL